MADWQGGEAPRKSGIGWCGIVLLIGIPVALVVLAAAGLVVVRALHVARALRPTSAPFPASYSSTTYARPATSARTGLAPLWSFGSLSAGVAVDRGEGIVYASDGSECVVLDPDGKEKRRFAVGCASAALKAAQLDADAPLEIVVFQYFSDPTVYAYDSDGSQLWSYPTGGSIDDVALADIDGDGRAETLIGLGSPAGVRVLDPDGNLLWQGPTPAEVPFISGADGDGDGDVDVAAHVREEYVQFYEADGTPGQRWSDIARLEFARTVPPCGGDVRLLVAGIDDSGEAALGIGADGAQVWRTPLSPGETSFMGPCEVAPKAGLVSMACAGGAVVLDLKTGERLASASGPSPQAETAWLEREGEDPILFIVREGAVTAFRLGESESPSESAVESGAGAAGTPESGESATESRPSATWQD